MTAEHAHRTSIGLKKGTSANTKWPAVEDRPQLTAALTAALAPAQTAAQAAAQAKPGGAPSKPPCWILSYTKKGSTSEWDFRAQVMP